MKLRWLIPSMLIPFTAQAAPAHPVVLELFTSQGCSSCPPADAILARWAAKPGVLALSYHVSYWNHLGWVDPYSLQESTARQKAYATAHRFNVYTPQLIVQGANDMVGAREDLLEAAVGNVADDWLPVTLEKKNDQLRIRLAARPGTKADLLLIGYWKQQANDVPRGENAGTIMAHRNNVAEIRPLGAWDGAALDRAEKLTKGDGVAVLVQLPNHGSIVGAGWLD